MIAYFARLNDFPWNQWMRETLNSSIMIHAYDDWKKFIITNSVISFVFDIVMQHGIKQYFH